MHLISNRIIILLLILPLSACDQASNFEDIEKSANQGDALSQALLGEAYVNAEGVSQDYKKAFEWYIKAAKQGNVDAQNNLGALFNVVPLIRPLNSVL